MSVDKKFLEQNKNFEEEYMNKSVGFTCPSCKMSGMAAKPEKDGKFYCPNCGCIIRGNIMNK